MNEGWIKLHRQIEEWEFYFDEPFDKAHAWIDLLILANHKSRSFSIRGNMIQVNRGEIGWSKQKLAQRWRWSRGKVIRFLRLLETRQQISQQNSAILSKIIIINYDKYQVDGTTDGTTERQQTVHKQE